MKPLAWMLWSRLGRKKYGLTGVDSINILKLRISLDDTLDVHFRTQMPNGDSFDGVATSHEELTGFLNFSLSSATSISELEARY